MTYEPRGRVAALYARMALEPARIFSARECAEIMGCKSSAVGPTVEYAVRARRIFKRNTGKRVEYSLTEMPGSVVLKPARQRTKHPEKMTAIESGWATDPNDLRIPRVVEGWTPPKMVCTRGGA